MIAMIVAIKGSCAWVGSPYAILSVEAMMVLCVSVYPYVVTINSGAFPCVSKKCRGERPLLGIPARRFQTRTGSTGHLATSGEPVKKGQVKCFKPERAPQAI